MVTRRFRFTLVSYNILAQSLLHDHSYLYNNCNPHDLEWPRRGHRIVRQLINDRADIICLQEVESDHLQTLYRPRLAHYGYECLYKKKTGYKLDGCAIFYKSNLFHLSNFKGVEFNRTDVAYLLNRDNVGLIAVLKPRITTRSESSHLVIANTHLIFNPKRSDIKLAQLKYFLSELEAISRNNNCDSNNSTTSPSSSSITTSSSRQTSSGSSPMKPTYHPTILCGDLNSTPDSAVVRYIMKNLKNPNGHITSNSSTLRQNDQQINECEHLETNRSHNEMKSSNSVHTREAHNQDFLESTINDRLARFKLTDANCHIDNEANPIPNLDGYDHGLQFKSSYPTQNCTGHRYVSTFSREIVDYIFYSPTLKLESYKELLTEEQFDDVCPIPNSKFPSDHITLGAKFTMR